jgi:hypothetical protein
MSEGWSHAVAGFALRHLSEQYLTSSQFRSHFFRHVKGLPQMGQTFVGRWELLRWGMLGSTHLRSMVSASEVSTSKSLFVTSSLDSEHHAGVLLGVGLDGEIVRQLFPR